MSSLKVGKFIGSGAYGNVYHAQWEGRNVAIKKFPLARSEVDQLAAIKHEVEMMKALADRHIIQFYGTAYHEEMLVLVMRYAEGGSLKRAIDARRLVDWPTKERIAQEIVRGLAYIHHKGVLHRDLKSMNVLLTRHMEVKLCDFGLATVKVHTESKSKFTGALKGTLRWMAPELFKGHPKYSTKSDMYALGMVMWEIAANCTVPFRKQPNAETLMVLVKSGEREVLPVDTPATYREWVERCWAGDASKRPEASEMVTPDEEDENEGESDVAGREKGGATTLILSRNLSTPLSSCATKVANEVIEQPLADEVSALLTRAEKNDVEAQVAVAVRYERGLGVIQNDVDAFKWYLRAAALGCIEAQSKLGDFFYYGRGTRKDHSTAVYWMRRAAHQGHPQAQYDVGWMYQNGFGVKQDYALAMSWYLKSAEQANAMAQFSLGWMYQKGLGVERDYAQAVSWYLKAVEQDNAVAQSNLGWMYQYGCGVQQNYGEALVWYRKSAEQGNAMAQSNLGWMYQKGLGVPFNYDKALHWYKKSAAQGNTEAQNNLGWMFEYGFGVERDYDQAVRWYRESAEQGNASAQYNLGAMYQNGCGVEQDNTKALFWYRQSAEQGYALAQKNLGWMYQNGRGVPVDTQRAIEWYRKAAHRGDKDAIDRLAALESPIESFFRRMFS